MLILFTILVILSPMILGLRLDNIKISASLYTNETPEVLYEKGSPVESPVMELNVQPRNSSINESSTNAPSTTRVLQRASIAVCPQSVNLTVGDSVAIDVNVINMTDLQGYDFKLRYNNTIITATKANLGDFFPKNSWVIRKEIDSSNGIVWVAVCNPLGSGLKFSGNGTLATVYFKAVSNGSCILELYDTMLVVDDGRDYRNNPHDIINGYIQCEIFEHEIAAYLDSPIHLEPGSSWLVKGLAINKGLCNETDVSFEILIDGEVVNSTIASLITTGSSINLTYMFAPTEERIYNMTANVKPTPNEEHTKNNVASATVVVRSNIKVPQDYATIQEAIDAAVPGETIIIASGVYHENIGIDKPLTLIGESCNTTVIDGDGKTLVIVVIQEDNVKFNGFTIRNGSAGILLEYSKNSVITGNIITNTMDAFYLEFSHNNIITFNTLKDNENGLILQDSNNNTIYYNNFLNNKAQAVAVNSQNTWDNGVEGNYWSDYKGKDANDDKIGDTPYLIDKSNLDNYPLMKQKHG